MLRRHESLGLGRGAREYAAIRHGTLWGLLTLLLAPTSMLKSAKKDKT